jgi:hypothetical protein
MTNQLFKNTPFHNKFRMRSNLLRVGNIKARLRIISIHNSR